MSTIEKLSHYRAALRRFKKCSEPGQPNRWHGPKPAPGHYGLTCKSDVWAAKHVEDQVDREEEPPSTSIRTP